MVRIKKHWLEIVIVSLLFLVGLFFRLKGIGANHSFWSDEAYLGAVSRDILNGRLSFTDGLALLSYQKMQVISNLISFKLFGYSEWSARLPSVIWGSLGIVFAYLLARKYANRWGGFLAAFLYTFLQLNLAHSTQAKPYAAIETLLLMVIYFVGKNIFLAGLLAILAASYNYLGFVSFVPLVIHLIQRFKRVNKPLAILFCLFFSLCLFKLFSLGDMFSLFSRINYNWLTYSREIFWRQYAFISLPAVFGLFLIKEKKIFWAITLSLFLLLFSWNFISYSHNLRYLLPVFGLLVVLFGIFWGKVGEILFAKPFLVCSLVAVLLFAGGYKIIRRPALYYTPNVDLFADVQNADYKRFFQEISTHHPDFADSVVYADSYDYLSWYADKIPTAIFSKGQWQDNLYPYIKVPVFSSVGDFIAETKKNPQGYLIVEDWQSFTPEDVKEYAKENLKLELSVESLSLSPGDKWPLLLYSWGFNHNVK